MHRNCDKNMLRMLQKNYDLGSLACSVLLCKKVSACCELESVDGSFYAYGYVYFIFGQVLHPVQSDMTQVHRRTFTSDVIQ